MRVDIWSDVRCPFCYIGKRKFEAALEKFPYREDVIIDWHSYELDPGLKAQPGKSIYDYLAERKGMARGQSVQVHRQMTQSASEIGIIFNFDKTVVAPSFDAHRLIQFAKKHGKSEAAEEILFRAYFTDGEDISNHATLSGLGIEMGLRKELVEEMLRTDACAAEVRRDQLIAQSIGVTGVPFFVINEQYSISGAQDPAIFLKALQQAHEEFKNATVAEPAKTEKRKK